MPAPIPLDGASPYMAWSETDRQVIQRCLGEVTEYLGFRGVSYRIKVKTKNATEAEDCPSLSEAVRRKPRGDITLVIQKDGYRIRVIGMFGSRHKCVQLRVDGKLPKPMELLVDALAHEIDSQCKQPTERSRYWLGWLWRWFFAKVSPGIVAAILAPSLVGAVLFVRTWLAG